MPYMVTFTMNIPPMLAYIYHTWILWLHEVTSFLLAHHHLSRLLFAPHEQIAPHEPSCFQPAWGSPSGTMC